MSIIKAILRFFVVILFVQGDLLRISNNAFDTEAQGAPTFQPTSAPTSAPEPFATDSYILVGAPWDSPNNLHFAGTVYVFRQDNPYDVTSAWKLDQTLMDPDLNADHEFGWSVAALGAKRVVVGASGSYHAGAAYVFRRDLSGDTGLPGAFELESVLVRSGARGGYYDHFDYFGSSLTPVGGAGHCVAVGAPGDYLGAVHVFTLEGDGRWVEIAELQAQDGVGGDHFGWSVASPADTDDPIMIHQVAVGAKDDDDVGREAGAVYVFGWVKQGSAWVETAQLYLNPAQDDAFFGTSVAFLHSFQLVVGARGVDTDTGAVAIFRRDEHGGEWMQEQIITAMDRQNYDYFGYSVADLGPERLAVGAMHTDDKGTDSGSVYVFDLVDGTWTESWKIFPPDGSDFDYFGWSLSSLKGSKKMVVGARGKHGYTGVAYRYHVDGDIVAMQQVLEASPTTGAGFGFTVCGYLPPDDADSTHHHRPVNHADIHIIQRALIVMLLLIGFLAGILIISFAALLAC